MLDSIPSLPVADAVESFMDLLTGNFSSLFEFVQSGGKTAMEFITDILIAVPPVVFIILIALIAFFATRKKFGLAVFSIIGLLFIYNQGLWEELMNTITLVIFASIIAIIIGIPFGILMSKSSIAEAIVKPILDFMQTMPGFVYLIPAVAFLVLELYLVFLRQLFSLCHRQFVLLT